MKTRYMEDFVKPLYLSLCEGRGYATRRKFSQKVTGGRATEKKLRLLCIILQERYYQFREQVFLVLNVLQI